MAYSMEMLQHSQVEPKVMSLHLLKQITNNFSEERTLGRGAYGTVYKVNSLTSNRQTFVSHQETFPEGFLYLPVGFLAHRDFDQGVQDGREIAVKMLHIQPTQDIDDFQPFKKEFENLMRLRHPNIVGLLGYCYETSMEYVTCSDGRKVFAERIYRALCLEYMNNGSLQKYLYDESEGLDWRTRYKIIKGTCEGLQYLHGGSERATYHLDLKPDNILLDENMVPKLADFGLSRLVNNNNTHPTESSLGTIGYVPPEFLDRGLVSNKFDIFSLGVILIKTMTGNNGYSRIGDMSSQEFIELVHNNWRIRLEAEPGCTSLEAQCNQVKTCIETALNCVQADRRRRPTIGDIITSLEETEDRIVMVYSLHESHVNKARHDRY